MSKVSAKFMAKAIAAGGVRFIVDPTKAQRNEVSFAFSGQSTFSKPTVYFHDGEALAVFLDYLIENGIAEQSARQGGE